MTALPVSQSRTPQRLPVGVRLAQGHAPVDVFAPLPYAPVDLKQFAVEVLDGAVGDGAPVTSADDLENAIVAALVSRVRRPLDAGEKALIGMQAAFTWNDRHPKSAPERIDYSSDEELINAGRGHLVRHL
jgi:hypothetical protein